MSTPLKALIVEDSADDAQLLLAELRRGGYDVTWERVDTAEAMRAALSRQPWDIVIADYKMPGFSGLAALELLKASGRGLPFIIVSGTMGEEQAVAAMKAGAHDYLMKDKLGRLVSAVKRELHDAALWREHRRAELALRESEEKFRSLFESSQDAIMILEPPSWRFTAGNPAAAKMFGERTGEGFISHEPGELSPDRQPDGSASAEKSKEKIETAVRNGSCFFEWTHRRISGEEFPADVLLTRMGQGEKMVIQATVRDLTERKQADRKVREQAALLDNANDAIYVTALDRTILYWNQGAERTYGWTSAEVMNRKTSELLSTDPVAAEALTAVLLKQESWFGERWQITKDGRKVEVFSRLTLVRNEQGQPQSVFAINTDITEKRQLEAQFLRAQRLESIGALASGIAHDLNNVLAPILIGAPLVREMVTDATARRLLKTMESSAQRGAAIVRQVLTFARGVEGERAPLQPRHLLTAMENLAAETFPKNIKIETDVAADLWPILGDATQLDQALLNLCVNARDAMPGGGILTFSAANVVLSKEAAEKIPGARPGSYACLRVTDTGTGIPPEIQAKLFEPFFTTKDVGKGTGLGLSTTLGIVRSHGGFIRIASKVGQGTTFELYLPATKTEEVAVKKDSAKPWPRAHGTGILVVDDETAVREVIRQTLAEFGYQVITAGRGNEALRIFKERQQEIQLVLTDMMMPEMDGPTLVAALRVLDPTVRIVGITGMSDTGSKSGLKALELSAMVAKPFTINKLLTVIREALPVTAGAERNVTDGGTSLPSPPG